MLGGDVIDVIAGYVNPREALCMLKVSKRMRSQTLNTLEMRYAKAIHARRFLTDREIPEWLAASGAKRRGLSMSEQRWLLMHHVDSQQYLIRFKDDGGPIISSAIAYDLLKTVEHDGHVVEGHHPDIVRALLIRFWAFHMSRNNSGE